MSATPEEISTYLLNITKAQSDYGKKVARYYALGRYNIKNEMIKIMVLSRYVQMLEKYFSQTDYENNNFFTTDEAKEVMKRINTICKTFFNLDI